MRKKIIITGATGLIGRQISKRLIEAKNHLIIFTRNLESAKSIIKNAQEYVLWNYENSSEWKNKLNGTDAVIHLAGENLISKRWTKEFKKRIYNSRVLTTRALVNVISQLTNKPQDFISASAVGYYGNRETEVDEYQEKGEGFLADLVNDWENETKPLENYGVRRVNIRLGTVLSKDGGALSKLIPQFKLFLGGTLGSRNQWFPWIHVEDAVEIFLFALNNSEVQGVLNAVAPEQIRMKDFSKVLGKVLKRPSYLNVPSFILKLILGEASEALLNGAKVIPKRTLEYGYQFRYANLNDALTNLLRTYQNK